MAAASYCLSYNASSIVPYLFPFDAGSLVSDLLGADMGSLEKSLSAYEIVALPSANIGAQSTVPLPRARERGSRRRRRHVRRRMGSLRGEPPQRLTLGKPSTGDFDRLLRDYKIDRPLLQRSSPRSLRNHIRAAALTIFASDLAVTDAHRREVRDSRRERYDQSVADSRGKIAAATSEAQTFKSQVEEAFQALRDLKHRSGETKDQLSQALGREHKLLSKLNDAIARVSRLEEEAVIQRKQKDVSDQLVAEMKVQVNEAEEALRSHEAEVEAEKKRFAALESSVDARVRHGNMVGCVIAKEVVTREHPELSQHVDWIQAYMQKTQGEMRSLGLLEAESPPIGSGGEAGGKDPVEQHKTSLSVCVTQEAAGPGSQEMGHEVYDPDQPCLAAATSLQAPDLQPQMMFTVEELFGVDGIEDTCPPEGDLANTLLELGVSVPNPPPA